MSHEAIHRYFDHCEYNDLHKTAVASIVAHRARAQAFIHDFEARMTQGK
jgi:hypothetical protein